MTTRDMRRRDVWTYAGLAELYWQYRTIVKRVQRDGTPFTDIAMTPVQDGE
jgi:hypothetical protein